MSATGPGGRALVRATASLFAGEAVARAAGFALLVGVSRRLGPDGLGHFVFAQATVGYAALLVDLGLTTVVLRRIVSRPAGGARQILHATLAQLVVATTLLTAAGVIVAGGNRGEDWRAVLALSPLLLAQALNLSYTAQAAERMAFVAMTKVVREVVATALGFALLATGGTAARVLPALWVGQLCADALLVTAARRRGLLKWQRPTMAEVVELVRAGSPFLLAALLVQVIMNFDIVVLRAFVSADEVGLYAGAYRLALYTALAAGVLSTAIFPRLVALWSNDPDGFSALVGKALHLAFALGVPLVMAVYVAGEQILGLIYGGQFDGAVSVLRITFPMVVLGWHNTVVGHALLATANERANLAITTIAAALTVALLLAAAPALGIEGAALVAVTVEVISTITFSRVARRRLGVSSLRPAVLAAPVTLGASAGLVVAGALSDEVLTKVLAIAVGAAAGWVSTRGWTAELLENPSRRSARSDSAHSGESDEDG